jgi:hypothetical protein
MGRLTSAWRVLNAPCREFSRLASESLDRDLTALERFALGTHTLYCAGCRRYRRQVALLRAAMRRLAGSLDDPSFELPGPDLPPEARERIESALRQG